MFGTVCLPSIVCFVVPCELLVERFCYMRCCCQGSLPKGSSSDIGDATIYFVEHTTKYACEAS